VRLIQIDCFMKKFLAILTLVVFVSSFTTTDLQKVKSLKSVTVKTTGGNVPEEVMVTYNQVVTDVMNNWYPGNSGWDDSQVNWDRAKGEWKSTGFVGVNGGNGAGIMIVDGVFRNTGEFVRFFYNVVQ
jgi:hypothetical protein